MDQLIEGQEFSLHLLTKNLKLTHTHTHIYIYIYIWSNYSDLTRPHPKWWFSKGNPLISGKSRLVKYYNLARYIDLYTHTTVL